MLIKTFKYYPKFHTIQNTTHQCRGGKKKSERGGRTFLLRISFMTLNSSSYLALFSLARPPCTAPVGGQPITALKSSLLTNHDCDDRH